MTPGLVELDARACSKCKTFKPLAAFGKDKGTRDGLYSSCRECGRAQSLRYRYANLEKVQAKHREYLRANWGRTQENLKRVKERSPEKVLARSRMNNAIRKGILARLPCEKCGDPKSQGHHDDYSKPLEVHWMCHRCHMQEHRRTAEGLAATAVGL